MSGRIHIASTEEMHHMSLKHDNIDYFKKGELKMGGETYTEDIIVCPDSLYSWIRNGKKSLSINDFQSIISERPAYLIIGNGYENSLQLDDHTKKRLSDLGFDLYVAKTRSAIKKYNNTCKKRKTIGLFHID